MTTNCNNWGSIIKKLNGFLNLNPKTVKEISEESGLDEATVRNFLPLANSKELILQNEKKYIIVSEPKKISIRQTIRIALELAKLCDEDPKMLNPNQVYERVLQIKPEAPKNSVTSQLSQMATEGIIERQGYERNYVYGPLPEGATPVRRTPSTTSSKSYTDMLMEITEFVERVEVENKELRAENAELRRKLDKAKALFE